MKCESDDDDSDDVVGEQNTHAKSVAAVASIVLGQNCDCKTIYKTKRSACVATGIERRSLFHQVKLLKIVDELFY